MSESMPVVRMVPWRYPLELPRWDGNTLHARVPRGRLLAPSIRREGVYGVQIEMPAPIVVADQTLLTWYRWIPVATVTGLQDPFVEMELSLYLNHIKPMGPCPACGYLLGEMHQDSSYYGRFLSCGKAGHRFPAGDFT